MKETRFNRALFCASVILAVFFLSGCGKKAESSPASSSVQSIITGETSAAPAPTATAAPTLTPTPTPVSSQKQPSKQADEIEKIKAEADASEFTIKYNDGSKVKLKKDTHSELDTPDLQNVHYEDGNLIFDISGDETECLYGIFFVDPNGNINDETYRFAYGKGDFQISIEYKQTYVYRRFVVAALKDGYAPAVSNEKYIENPQDIAEETFDYPEQASKKGLQISVDRLDDVAELGVRHAVVNVPLEKLLEPVAYGTSPEEYYFAGGRYDLNPEFINYLDKQFGALGSMDITTNAVLVLQYTNESVNMIHPGAASGQHRYYAFDLTEPEKVQMYAALFTFLAERYSTPEYGVVNWILGNEVGNYTEWNWSGNIAFDEYIHNYVEAFRILYQCTRAVYADAKCMISLDHCWNQERPGAYTTKQILDAFAQEAEEYGACEWWVAYHPYGEPLTDTSFWSADNRVTDSIDTQCITMKNLKVLTDYIRENWGDEHKLVLSETGFSSSTQGEEVQAAAIAYAYELSEANDMVSSLIIHRHIDEPEESKDNLALGLRHLDGTPKYSWQVYKDMDVNPESTKFALKLLGASDWNAIT